MMSYNGTWWFWNPWERNILGRQEVLFFLENKWYFILRILKDTIIKNWKLKEVIAAISNSFCNVEMAPSFDLFSINVAGGWQRFGKGRENPCSRWGTCQEEWKHQRDSDYAIKWLLLSWKGRVAEILADKLYFVLFPQCLPPPPPCCGFSVRGGPLSLTCPH